MRTPERRALKLKLTLTKDVYAFGSWLRASLMWFCAYSSAVTLGTAQSIQSSHSCLPLPTMAALVRAARQAEKASR